MNLCVSTEGKNVKLQHSMYASCCNRIGFEVAFRVRASGHAGVERGCTADDSNMLPLLPLPRKQQKLQPSLEVKSRAMRPTVDVCRFISCSDTKKTFPQVCVLTRIREKVPSYMHVTSRFFTESSVILAPTFVSLYCWSWYSCWPGMEASGS